ncbi:hypothetical protein VNO77_10038 [Canavalia gladiata]|uniref:Uncharacterized protein n=1 Tax=Canavalia gladiata TaxID=3824 RepID=A0AAN9MAK0_CANGL
MTSKYKSGVRMPYKWRSRRAGQKLSQPIISSLSSSLSLTIHPSFPLFLFIPPKPFPNPNPNPNPLLSFFFPSQFPQLHPAISSNSRVRDFFFLSFFFLFFLFTLLLLSKLTLLRPTGC